MRGGRGRPGDRPRPHHRRGPPRLRGSPGPPTLPYGQSPALADWRGSRLWCCLYVNLHTSHFQSRSRHRTTSCSEVGTPRFSAETGGGRSGMRSRPQSSAAATPNPVPPARKTPSRPKSWANCSLLQPHSHRNARADLHLLGQPNAFPRSRVPRTVARSGRGIAASASDDRARLPWDHGPPFLGTRRQKAPSVRTRNNPRPPKAFGDPGRGLQ